MFRWLRCYWRVRKLKHANCYKRQDAAYGLAALGDSRSMKAIAATIDSEDEPYTLYHKALALAKFGRAAVPLLTQLLERGGMATEGAALALARIKDKSPVPVLVQLLQQYSHEPGAAIAYALGELGDEQAREPLYRVVSSDLGRPFPRSVPAAEALANLGDPRGVDLLIRLMQMGHWTIRGNAASALGRTGDARSKEALIRALGDHVGRDVPRQAAEALELLGEGRWKSLLSPPEFSQRLGESSDCRAVDPLVVLLATHPDNRAREIAKKTLGKRLGGPGGTQALKRLHQIADNDCEESVRQAASKMLEQIRDQGE